VNRQAAPCRLRISECKIHRCLDVRFCSRGYKDPVKSALTEVFALGHKRVFPGREPCETVAPVFLCDGSSLCASSRIAQHNGGAIEWRRMQIGQSAAQGSEFPAERANRNTGRNTFRNVNPRIARREMVARRSLRRDCDLGGSHK
jgi:hypothetical protein